MKGQGIGHSGLEGLASSPEPSTQVFPWAADPTP